VETTGAGINEGERERRGEGGREIEN